MARLTPSCRPTTSISSAGARATTKSPSPSPRAMTITALSCAWSLCVTLAVATASVSIRAWSMPSSWRMVCPSPTRSRTMWPRDSPPPSRAVPTRRCGSMALARRARSLPATRSTCTPTASLASTTPCRSTTPGWPSTTVPTTSSTTARTTSRAARLTMLLRMATSHASRSVSPTTTRPARSQPVRLSSTVWPSPISTMPRRSTRPTMMVAAAPRPSSM